MEEVFDNKSILAVVRKSWMQLCAATLAGMVVAGAATYLVRPRFESSAVVYPSNLGTYSEETHTEQMIQLLQSRDIADSVMQKNALTAHWGIADNDKHAIHKKYSYYYDFVTIRKTPYESIEISALDVDPEMSKSIVDDILFYYNQKVKKLHYDKLAELIATNRMQVEYWTDEVAKSRVLVERILQDAGVKNFTKAVDLFTDGEFEFYDDRKYTNFIMEEKKREGRSALTYKTKNVTAEISKATSLGPIFFDYFRIYTEQVGVLAKFKIEMEQQEIENQKEISYYSLVTPPYASDKKYSPKRVPIALLGGLGAFCVAFVVCGMGIRSKEA